jgi:fructose-bisphosphate aldolase, class II
VRAQPAADPALRQPGARRRSIEECLPQPRGAAWGYSSCISARTRITLIACWRSLSASSSFDDNLRQTKEAVLALKALRPEILVEGEIGDIGSGSQIHDSAPHRPLTTPDEALRFVQETAIDTLAPAVGNMHGVLKSMLSGDARKHLDIERIRAIKDRTRIFMTLHGGSDTADADLRGAIAAGMTVVHINTEVRLAWRRGIEESFATQKDDIAPYTLLAPAVEAVKRVVGGRLALFSGDPP